MMESVRARVEKTVGTQSLPELSPEGYTYTIPTPVLSTLPSGREEGEEKKEEEARSPALPPFVFASPDSTPAVGKSM